MRRDPTPAERRLWGAWRNQQVRRLKFRRQQPLGPFIVDFYCASARLVIELDGVSHICSRRDAARDAWLRAQRLRVLRFTNYDVFSNLEGVVLAIGEAALGDGHGYAPPTPPARVTNPPPRITTPPPTRNDPSPQPPPARGGGGLGHVG